jgi:hypothetical protein
MGKGAATVDIVVSDLSEFDGGEGAYDAAPPGGGLQGEGPAARRGGFPLRW